MLRKEKAIFITCFWLLVNLITICFLSDKMKKNEVENRWNELEKKIDSFKIELEKWEKE